MKAQGVNHPIRRGPRENRHLCDNDSPHHNQSHVTAPKTVVIAVMPLVEYTQKDLDVEPAYTFHRPVRALVLETAGDCCTSHIAGARTHLLWPPGDISRTQRKPTFTIQLPSMRFDTRTSSACVFQEPPRITRCCPRGAPFGSALG